MIKKYFLNILISLDQLLNTFIGGDPDETISSRCGKIINSCKLCKGLCFILDKIDPKHCKDSIEWDEGFK